MGLVNVVGMNNTRVGLQDKNVIMYVVLQDELIENLSLPFFLCPRF